MLKNTSTVGNQIAMREDCAAPRSVAPLEIERMRCDGTGRVLRVSGWLPLSCRLDDPAAEPAQS